MEKLAEVSQTAEKPRGGRFVKGGVPGPGRPPGSSPNPFRREIQSFLAKQSGDGRTHLQEQVQAAHDRAVAGDSVVLRLLWEYGIGKPPMSDEDRETAEATGTGRAAILAALEKVTL